LPIDKIYHPAALLSAVTYYALGWLWYGWLFRGAWMNLALLTPSFVNSGDPVPPIVAAAMSLVLAYVVALVRDQKRSVTRGARFGLFMGVGLVASTMLVNYLFEGRPVELWLINSGYVVLGLMMIGAIVGGWKKSAAAQ
jgi:Protein of unknown function (DUF1761)